MQTRHSRLRPPSPALVIACLALFAALGGGAYAASTSGGKKIQFTNAHLQNGWQAGNKTNHLDAPPGYAKDSLGVVHLRGAVFGGGNDTVAFVLPRALRPSHLVYVPIFSQNATGNVLIEKNGKVILFGGNVTAFAVLDGVSFVAGE